MEHLKVPLEEDHLSGWPLYSYEEFLFQEDELLRELLIQSILFFTSVYP